jgi:serine/threonine protein kinase
MYAPNDVVKGHYRVHKLLGEGGMNRVYLVSEIKGAKKYALKVTKAPGEVDSSLQEVYSQFQREISILTTHSHPALPRVVEHFTEGGNCCVVEEYIRGVSMESHVALKLPDQIDVVDWGIALCDVLDYLHKEGIIFRDLKPANIILKKNGRVKLIDFDIARFYKKGKKADTTSLGTPGYAAPETYGDSQSDVRSDIYSLGATLHHLITGVCPEPVPFHFEPICRLRPGVSPKLARIIERALSMNPRKRFNSALDMKQQLMVLKMKLTAPVPASRRGKGARPQASPAQGSPPQAMQGAFPIISRFMTMGAGERILWLIFFVIIMLEILGLLYIRYSRHSN